MINKKRKLTQKKIIKKLSKFIKKGDIINCEFDLAKFNQVANISKNKDQFIKFFLDIFRINRKKGTLIIPGFSYSWGKNKKKNFLIGE